MHLSDFRYLSKLLLVAVSLLPFAADAQSLANGYYRVVNYKTNRYVYLRDDKSWVNAGATDIELGAIQLWRGFDMAASDAATVMYFQYAGTGSQYDIQAQGTGVHAFTDMYVSLRAVDDAFYIYGTNSGLTKYLGDARANNTDEGVMSSGASGDYRKWYIKPITANGDNYFGVKPTVSVGGKHYKPFFAAFPFSTYSTGMKVYCIKTVGYGMAVLSEITGTVPAGTPVLIECSKNSAADNRLQIGGNGSAVSGNLLGGVYFCNTSTSHKNLTPYNANTMRVLGVTADGSLGFITSNITNLPANESYLNVPAGTPAQLKIVTQAEYDKYLATRPTGISLNASSLELLEGESFKLTATVAPANATDYTITWSSSNTAAATVDNNGQVKAVKAGTTTITARINDTIYASCTVTVKLDTRPVSISLNAKSLELIEGDSFKLVATVLPSYAANYTITWSSSNASVASVDNTGQVKALVPGTATITARINDTLYATCNVTVKLDTRPKGISLDATSLELVAGSSHNFTATVTPSYAEGYEINWSSSVPDVASVNNAGQVKALTVGTTIITARINESLYATCLVTVKPLVIPLQSILLSAEAITLVEQTSVELSATPLPANATDYAPVWATADAAVATVSADGLVTGVAPGQTVITVTSGTVKAECSVTILPIPEVFPDGIGLNITERELRKGETVQLSATVSPDNADNKTLSWQTSNSTVATVDSDGLVTAVGGGIATITATTVNGLSASCSIMVNVPVESLTLDRSQISIPEGNSFFLTATVLPADATNKELRWESSNTSIATVTQDGIVNVLNIGIVDITVHTLDGSNLSSTCTVNVQSGLDTVLAENTTVDVYTLQGFLIMHDADADFIASLKPGVYIVAAGNTRTKIYIKN